MNMTRRVDDILAAKPGIPVSEAIAQAANEINHPASNANPCPDFWHIGEGAK